MSSLKDYIENGQDDLIREYLQNMFWNATKHNYIRREEVPYKQLEYLITSKNDKIRKWAYYATCFYSNENIIETLKKNIFNEKNELIRSWMVATARKANIGLYEELKKNTDINLSLETINLIEDLFSYSNNTTIDKKFMDRVINNDSMLDKFWLTFNYKYKPYIRKIEYDYTLFMGYISKLTNLTTVSSTDKQLFQVEEYALSALCHYTPCSNFSFSEHVDFNIDDIKKRDPAPRKWAYTLFWKDNDYVNKNIDCAIENIDGKPMETKDREGFAKGLSDYYDYNEDLEFPIVEWYLQEDNILCKKYLCEYMRKHKKKSNEFAKQVEDSTTNIEKNQTTIIQKGDNNIAQIGNNNTINLIE